MLSLHAISNGRRTFLQSIDGAVKAHEKTHLLTLGAYAQGGISYDFIILPTGEKYAVGGSVGVDMKPVPGDPEATIRKMRIIRAASLGPMDPSGPDKHIAETALLIEMLAKHELETRDNEKTGKKPTAPRINGAQKIADIQPVPGDPEATIRKAESARREALASGDISLKVMQQLTQAYVMEMRAERELRDSEESKHISLTA